MSVHRFVKLKGYDLMSPNHQAEFYRLRKLQMRQWYFSAQGIRNRVFTQKDQLMLRKYYDMMGYLYTTR